MANFQLLNNVQHKDLRVIIDRSADAISHCRIELIRDDASNVVRFEYCHTALS